jgi:hypothetical protein
MWCVWIVFDVWLLRFGGSSKGRTPDFESENLGSNPSPPVGVVEYDVFRQFGDVMSSLRRPVRSLSVYEDELRMYNDAQSVRRGKSARGFPPRFCEDVFSYKQPRRNEKGCGDVRWVNTVSGEITIVHCDDVRSTFKHRKAPKHSRYNLRYDRRDEE